jgi:hypothetical protein
MCIIYLILCLHKTVEQTLLIKKIIQFEKIPILLRQGRMFLKQKVQTCLDDGFFFQIKTVGLKFFCLPCLVKLFCVTFKRRKMI